MSTNSRHAVRKSSRTWLVVVSTILLSAISFAAVAVVTVNWHFNNAITTYNVDDLLGSNRPPKEVDTGLEDPSAGKALNILIIGSDVRDGSNASIGGHVDGMRSDVTMIMHISADRSRAEIVSIPRDTIIRVPDCQLFDGSTVKGWTAKFNVAFANGGKNGNVGEAAACTMRAVEEMTGLLLDHFIVLDFQGFANMVDALGGVPMCVPKHIKSKKAKLDLAPGAHLMDGYTALQYSRLRTGQKGGLSGSDLQRISRQHDLIMQIFRTAQSKDMFSDIDQLTAFLRSVLESMTTDSNFGRLNYMAGLAYSLRGLNTKNLVFTTMPWKYKGNDVDIVQPAADEMWAALRADQPITPFDASGTDAPWDSGREISDADSTTSPNSAGKTSAAPSASAEPTTSSSAEPSKKPSRRASVQDMLNECVVP